jgi:DNA-3-methyladenine glycosylase I
MTEAVVVQPIGPQDREWVRRFIARRWGAETVVAHGTVYRPSELPGFIALLNGKRAGVVTYHIDGTDCEIVSIDSVQPGQGIGTALITAVEKAARRRSCRRVWLITTNDNLNALGFYQKRGFTLVTIHRNALDISRRLKPEIPEMGQAGIPLRDEIELEMLLEA